jgi:hypothetical protein
MSVHVEGLGVFYLPESGKKGSWKRTSIARWSLLRGQEESGVQHHADIDDGFVTVISGIHFIFYPLLVLTTDKMTKLICGSTNYVVVMAHNLA